jgi:hypothetical protein
MRGGNRRDAARSSNRTRILTAGALGIAALHIACGLFVPLEGLEGTGEPAAARETGSGDEVVADDERRADAASTAQVEAAVDGGVRVQGFFIGDRLIASGTRLSYAQYPKGFDLIVRTVPEEVSAVRIVVNGATHDEQRLPYQVDTDPGPWKPMNGEYTIVATPFADPEKNFPGPSATISITVGP